MKTMMMMMITMMMKFMMMINAEKLMCILFKAVAQRNKGIFSYTLTHAQIQNFKVSILCNVSETTTIDINNGH